MSANSVTSDPLAVLHSITTEYRQTASVAHSGASIDLPTSEAYGALVRLPTPCGGHFVCYPSALVYIATRRREFYAFVTRCECPRAYLVHTEADGAHFKSEAREAAFHTLLARHEDLPAEEFVFDVRNGRFVRKRLPRA